MGNEDRPSPLGLGLIGCGGFGRFCIDAYRDLDVLRPVAVADADEAVARRLAEALGVCAFPDAAGLLASPEVDLVHVATPPASHHDLAMAALRAGKHVLCEKPLAVSVEQGRAMVEAARASSLVLGIDFIMRYNPLCQAMKTIIDEGLLGEPLHAFFENYAADESLPPTHWFWDREQSGSIFVEHGVHFFDLYGWWFGPGVVKAAHATRRPATGAVEQVCCTTQYGSVLAHFYHGFHQPHRMDRQEFRVVFERGHVSFFEWVPTEMRVDALMSDEVYEAFHQLFPGIEEEGVERYRGTERACRSRGVAYNVDGRVRLRYRSGPTKMELYAEVVRDVMADQIAAIRDEGHRRRVTAEDGLAAVEMAVEASRLAGILGGPSVSSDS